ALAHAHHAGIVDEHVDAPERADGASGHRGGLAAVDEVGDEGGGRNAGGLQFGGPLMDPPGGRGEGDARPFAAQQAGAGEGARARTARPGDERDPAGEAATATVLYAVAGRHCGIASEKRPSGTNRSSVGATPRTSTSTRQSSPSRSTR